MIKRSSWLKLYSMKSNQDVAKDVTTLDQNWCERGQQYSDGTL